MTDTNFINLAITQSQESVGLGYFPAGAIIVDKSQQVISSATSDKYPGYQHAECLAIDRAFTTYGLLEDCILYASMEPCVMCLTRAYWSGIRKIVFSVKKDEVNVEYYEGTLPLQTLIETLNQKVELIYLPQDSALKIVRSWEHSH